MAAAYWNGNNGLLGGAPGGQGTGAQIPGQFPRFNFGSGSSGWNPYIPQSYAQPAQSQTPTATGGANGHDYGSGGTIVDNLFGQGGIGNVPQDTNPAWNQSSPGQGSLPWQTYKFNDPTNSVQTNFNSLMQQNPTLAYKYLTSAGGGNEIQGLFSQYGQAPSTANYVANAFMQPNMVGDSGGPGGGTAYDYLGLKPGDIPMTGEVSGNTFSAGGLSGNLAQQGAYEQKMSDPRAFLQANPFHTAPSIGSANWWNSVQGR